MNLPPRTGSPPLHDIATSAFRIRRATARDVAAIAHHRVSMFHDMGTLPDTAVEPLRAATVAWLPERLASGEYVGWLASPAGEPDSIVAGAGVQVRRFLPSARRRTDGGADIAEGCQALVVNVYTERDWRRRGLARQLMLSVLAWASESRIESLVLHAAPDGRPLYESLGFQPTNEMRFMGKLAPRHPAD